MAKKFMFEVYLKMITWYWEQVIHILYDMNLSPKTGTRSFTCENRCNPKVSKRPRVSSRNWSGAIESWWRPRAQLNKKKALARGQTTNKQENEQPWECYKDPWQWLECRYHFDVFHRRISHHTDRRIDHLQIHRGATPPTDWTWKSWELSREGHHLQPASIPWQWHDWVRHWRLHRHAGRRANVPKPIRVRTSANIERRGRLEWRWSISLRLLRCAHGVILKHFFVHNYLWESQSPKSIITNDAPAKVVNK